MRTALCVLYMISVSLSVVSQPVSFSMLHHIDVLALCTREPVFHRRAGTLFATHRTEAHRRSGTFAMHADELLYMRDASVANQTAT